MNSKQRRKIWREHQTQIESLEFQYRVLAGVKPDRGITSLVPTYLGLLRQGVAARRALKERTGSSKGHCGDDPFTEAGLDFRGYRMRGLGKSMVQQLSKKMLDDWVKSALQAKAAEFARAVGAGTCPPNTGRISVQGTVPHRADDLVDSFVYGRSIFVDGSRRNFLTSTDDL